MKSAQRIRSRLVSLRGDTHHGHKFKRATPIPTRILNQDGHAFGFIMPQGATHSLDLTNYSRLQTVIPLLDVPRVYAAPNLTDTSFDTPGSCMVTP